MDSGNENIDSILNAMLSKAKKEGMFCVRVVLFLEEKRVLAIKPKICYIIKTKKSNRPQGVDRLSE